MRLRRMSTRDGDRSRCEISRNSPTRCAITWRWSRARNCSPASTRPITTSRRGNPDAAAKVEMQDPQRSRASVATRRSFRRRVARDHRPRPGAADRPGTGQQQHLGSIGPGVCASGGTRRRTSPRCGSRRTRTRTRCWSSSLQHARRANPAEAEQLLDGLPIEWRGQAYTAALVILGPRAPAEWRRGADRLLFVPERPYFSMVL